MKTYVFYFSPDGLKVEKVPVVATNIDRAALNFGRKKMDLINNIEIVQDDLDDVDGQVDPILYRVDYMYPNETFERFFYTRSETPEWAIDDFEEEIQDPEVLLLGVKPVANCATCKNIGVFAKMSMSKGFHELTCECEHGKYKSKIFVQKTNKKLKEKSNG